MLESKNTFIGGSSGIKLKKRLTNSKNWQYSRLGTIGTFNTLGLQY